MIMSMITHCRRGKEYKQVAAKGDIIWSFQADKMERARKSIEPELFYANSNLVDSVHAYRALGSVMTGASSKVKYNKTNDAL